MNDNFIRSIRLEQSDSTVYPFSIPAVQHIDTIDFMAPVTFLVGENGSGKSTIIEAIAIAAGFNAEGGTKNYNFSTQDTTSSLSEYITLIRGASREPSGYFLRAESFYTAVKYAESGPHPLLFDGKRMHEESHGEAFLSIVKDFKPGLFIFDEPESALSSQRQLALMLLMRKLVAQGSQFIIATHSPILLSYPKSILYELSVAGVRKIAYEDCDHVTFTRDFLSSPSRFLEHLFKL